MRCTLGQRSCGGWTKAESNPSGGAPPVRFTLHRFRNFSVSRRDRISEKHVVGAGPCERRGVASRSVVARSLVSPALLAVGLLVLGGCSSETKGDATPTTTTAVNATPSSSTRAPDATAAVLDGYRKFWDAYLAAADPMDPEHPGLAQHATGDELETLQKAFLARKAGGEVIRGSLDLAPKVVNVDGTTATVSDCYADNTHVYDAATGTQKDTSSGMRHLVTAKLVLVDEVWKVSVLTRERGGCVAAG